MASTYLTRTPGSAGNRKTWTFSAWVKRSTTSDNAVGYDSIFSTNISNEGINIAFGNGAFTADGDYFEVTHAAAAGGGTTDWSVRTNQLFRDVSGWYHLVVAFDTTQSTTADRVKLYVNGSEVDKTVTTGPALNTDYEINNTQQHTIGRWQRDGNSYFDGSMAHVHFIDGTAYDASAFGETDSTTSIWKPKLAPSVTYGTNGFFLKFASSGSMGTDSSGNGNNFTVGAGNLTQTQDTPSNVFATFNPLARNNGNTYTNGNTVYDYSNNYQKAGIGSQTFSSGKWYAEFKKNGSEMPHYGIAGDTYHSDGRTVTDTSGSWTYDIKGHTGTVVLQIDGSGTRNIWADGSDTGTDTDFYAGTGDIIMIAFDSDTGKIWFGKNGTWSNSGNPATGSNPTYTYSGSATKDFTFAVSTENSSSISANFGNGYFGTTAVSSANSDGDGIGLFEYEVPSGYYALCTKNINTYG